MPQIIQNIIVKSFGQYLNVLSHLHPQKGFAMAYTLFSHPRNGRLKKENLPKLLLKAEHETHFYNNQQFQTYTWKGNDEIILLVHGWESNANRWKEFLKQLKKTGKTIIAIDGPAHGLSDGKEFNVPLYAEFINVVVQKYQPQVLIGHSIGGTACAYYQHLFPNHTIQKMVLLGAPSDFTVLLQNYINILRLNTKIHNYLIDYTKERFNFTIADFSAAKFMEKSTIPGLIAHDLDDTVVLFEEAKKIAAAWKTAELIQTKGLGHSMHDNYLYQTVIDFLEA
jgi:pimeloyl-ACP methyl ester carboxylesterase